jgi:hypothetical protein
MPLSTDPRLTRETAARFAEIALGHVARAWPHKADHVFSGPEDVRPHEEFHPIFFGSFDWHSCVHGYWTLATLLRTFPDMQPAGRVRDLFDDAFTDDKVAIERAYLDRPGTRGFERPYGWGWLLMLQAELVRHDAPWAERLRPLAEGFVRRFHDYLPLAVYPVRTGVHSSTAFALALALEYAETVGDDGLAALLVETAGRWHAADADCQAWEPSGEDFLSPALMEAEAMRRVLGPRAFPQWFDRFLPRAAERQPATLFRPATVSDRTDGKIAHLDGLNLSRAWCWRSIASAMPAGHPVVAVARDAAEAHLEASLPHVAGDYMGEHWLASFALLALRA